MQGDRSSLDDAAAALPPWLLPASAPEFSLSLASEMVRSFDDKNREPWADSDRRFDQSLAPALAALHG